MKAPTLMTLAAWFSVMWLVLAALSRRHDESIDPSTLELLEHEQAAHDGFMRAMRKIGGGA